VAATATPASACKQASRLTAACFCLREKEQRRRPGRSVLRCWVKATLRALHPGASGSCGPFVRPDGVNFKLLELADDGLIDGFTTDVAAYEFVYNAYKGNLTRGDPVEPELVSEFLDGFPYLFDPATTPRVSIGRNVVERVWMLRKPVGRVVYDLTGRQRADLLTQLQDQQIVGIDDFDPTDLHLLVAAVEQDADIICTSNTTDFRQSAYGSIRVATPAALYREILDA